MKISLLFFLTFTFQASFAQEVTYFDLSSCTEKSYPEFIRHRIVYKEMKDNLLTLRVGIVLNCCIEPELVLTYSNDSLFVQIDNVAESICMCECCFEIEIQATGIPDTNFKVIYMQDGINTMGRDFANFYTLFELEEHSRKYVFPSPSELEAAENYSGEMNQLNEDGEKIGLWKIEKGDRYYLLNYILDNDGKSCRDWYAGYDADGELDTIGGNDGLGSSNSASLREYYLLFGIDILKKDF